MWYPFGMIQIKIWTSAFGRKSILRCMTRSKRRTSRRSPLSLRGAKRRTPGWPLLPLRGNSPSGNPFSKGSPVRKHGGAVAQRLRGHAACPPPTSLTLGHLPHRAIRGRGGLGYGLPRPCGLAMTRWGRPELLYEWGRDRRRSAWAVPHALQNWRQNLEKAVDNSVICAKIICDIATRYEKEAV